MLSFKLRTDVADDNPRQRLERIAERAKDQKGIFYNGKRNSGKSSFQWT
jgi:hypothetical protein